MWRSEYICLISGMEDQFACMAPGSTLSQCLLGYSSNKSVEWFYYCIDWKNCAALTMCVCVCECD